MSAFGNGHSTKGNRSNSKRPSVSAKPLSTPLAAGGTSGDAAPGALVSRRNFLYGAIGVGALAAVGIGAVAYTSATSADAAGVEYLNAPKSALTTIGDFEALENSEGLVQKMGEYDLPYGTLVWSNDSTIAACLLPTETGTPLTRVALLSLNSGLYTPVLEKAVGSRDGFEIYDVRANSKGLIWTEANILRGAWRVYAATVQDGGGSIGSPSLLEEGTNEYETPTLAVAGSRAFWQVNPLASEGDTPSARLMGATFGKDDTQIMLESERRMSSPPYAYGDTVTIAPRSEEASSYYQLTNLDAATGEVRDTLTLPRAIKPIEGGYGKTGFMFSFPDIYDYEGAISNLGTYLPRWKPENGDYNNAQWFDFARTPTAPPAWSKNLLIVKSTYSICGVDLDKGTYFALDVEDGADTYGEYLASTGESDTFVTYTNIDHKPVDAGPIHACRVKVWSPLT